MHSGAGMCSGMHLGIKQAIWTCTNDLHWYNNSSDLGLIHQYMQIFIDSRIGCRNALRCGILFGNAFGHGKNGLNTHKWFKLIYSQFGLGINWLVHADNYRFPTRVRHPPRECVQAWKKWFWEGIRAWQQRSDTYEWSKYSQFKLGLTRISSPFRFWSSLKIWFGLSLGISLDAEDWGDIDRFLKFSHKHVFMPPDINMGL